MCPWVGCRYHLFADVVQSTGSLKLNFPDGDPLEMKFFCALHEAGRGGLTLEQVAERMNMTRERVRQVEEIALAKTQRIFAKRGDK